LDLGNDVLAQVAVLAAALSYACAGLFGRRFAGTPPLATASGQLLCSTLLLLPAVAIVDAPWQLDAPSLRTCLAVAALALISTALAYVIYFRILAAAGATNLLLVTFLIPVTALLLGTGILGEVIAPRQLAGMAIIGAGLAAIDGRPLAHLRLRLRRLAAG
jgi:drug/metabolite transporter (DMT)-like permease